MNFRIGGQKVEMVKKTKYLGIILDKNLSFKYNIENLRFKLNTANGLLAKIRHYVQAGLRRTLYFALFDSHLRYGCQIWGQNQNPITNYITCARQNKAIRIINFKGRDEIAKPLYKSTKVLEFRNIIKLNNCFLVYDQLNNNLPQNFQNYFSLKSDDHNYHTRGSRINVPIVKITTYGSNSITIKAIKHWNEIQNSLSIDLNSQDTTRTKFVEAMKMFLENDE